MTLGDKRPSQLVAEIKWRFEDIGLAVDGAIVKSRLLSALPTNLRSALVGYDDCTLEQYSKFADSVVAVASSESPFINHLKSQPGESTSSCLLYTSPSPRD